MSQQKPQTDPECLALPRFERVKYFYGQLLGVRELQSEQSYFLEKHRLHNRYLHGYGVVCGLAVRPCKQPEQPCPEPKSEEPRELCVEIECGLALDCCGNEIAVPFTTKVDLLGKLECDAREEVLKGKPVYLSLCFVERPLEPVRPLTADGCGGLVPDCVPSRLRDDFCVKLSLQAPAHDRSCSSCERGCDDPRLLLAVARFENGALHVDDSVRRPLALYETTRIDSVSWVHDGDYRAEHADAMLREGLVIHFTDDVYTSTLRRGVFDVWIIQGGGNRSGDIYNAGVSVIPGNPGHEFSRSVIARVEGRDRDRIDPRDRVLIQLRSALVLDRCCRPVDGDHVGGLVPVHEHAHEKWPALHKPHAAPCARHAPRPLAPWTSGNGTPAGNFESWFYVADEDRKG